MKIQFTDTIQVIVVVIILVVVVYDYDVGVGADIAVIDAVIGGSYDVYDIIAVVGCTGHVEPIYLYNNNNNNVNYM